MADSNTKLKEITRRGKSTIQLPAYAPDKTASVVVVEFEGDPKNKWQAEKAEESATLEIDLGKAVSVQCLSLAEPWHPWDHVQQKYELQFQDASSWKTIFRAESQGTGLTRSFAPVSAQKFRLIFQNQTDAPGLNELLLFRAE